MLVSPSKVIFADEISTGLDSSTTFQIIQNLSHYAHKRKVCLLPQQAQRLAGSGQACVHDHAPMVVLCRPAQKP